MAEECEDKPKETMKASPVDANKNAPGNSCAHPVLVGRSSGVAAVVVAVSCFKQIAGLRKNTEQRPEAGEDEDGTNVQLVNGKERLDERGGGVALSSCSSLDVPHVNENDADANELKE